MNKLGIMHGRLSPPRKGLIQSFPWETWRQEFERAQECGLDLIEWIFEADNYSENPIFLKEGLEEIDRLSRKTGVSVQSVCADYFMDLPLLRISKEGREKRLQILSKLIDQCAVLGVRYIEMPFVDASAISSEAEILEVVDIFKRFAPIAKQAGVTLCLETDMGPESFSRLMHLIDHENVRINYDIGNSASLGYDTLEEVNTYGNFISTVHIKDRVLGGGTVPLGAGSANFDMTFSLLKKRLYDGPFILQPARQGDEVETIKGYVSYLRKNFPFFFDKTKA